MLKQIKYFQAVVRLNSFTKAAEECYISQSAISQQVKMLERELGVTLLKRENRRFSLTPAGEYFYRQSLILTADFDLLCKETTKIAGGNNFSLRVGHLKSYAGLEFPKAVALFAKKYPNVPIDIATGNHEELYELLRNYKVDLILSDQRRAFSSEYVNKILASINSFIEVSISNPLAKMTSVNRGDLRHLSCILIASKEEREHEQNYYQEIYGIISPVIFAESLEEARLMVVGGKGYLLVDGGSLPAQYTETIARLPFCRNQTPILRTYCAFWKIDNQGYYIEEFAQILKAQFNKSE